MTATAVFAARRRRPSAAAAPARGLGWGPAGADDIYRFTLDSPGRVFTRTTLAANQFAPTFSTRMRLVRDANGDGQIDPGDVLATSPGQRDFIVGLRPARKD